MKRGELLRAGRRGSDTVEILYALEKAASALSAMKTGTGRVLHYNTKLFKCIAGVK